MWSQQDHVHLGDIFSPVSRMHGVIVIKLGIISLLGPRYIDTF